MDGMEHWYAVYTRSHYEQKVYQALEEKSIPSFLPKVETISRRKDRSKKIWIPLFPGYLFFRIPWSLPAYWEIIKTQGVVKVLGVAGRPVPVDEQEVTSVRIMVDSLLPLSPHPFIREGDWVTIEEGPLKGAQGRLLARTGKGGKLVVGVELLNRAVAVELPPEYLKKI